MAGICSRHQHNEPTCKNCQVNLDNDPRFIEAKKRAKAAGEYTCECGFTESGVKPPNSIRGDISRRLRFGNLIVLTLYK